jgi:hypothetical protein
MTPWPSQLDVEVGTGGGSEVMVGFPPLCALGNRTR